MTKAEFQIKLLTAKKIYDDLGVVDIEFKDWFDWAIKNEFLLINQWKDKSIKTEIAWYRDLDGRECIYEVGTLRKIKNENDDLKYLTKYYKICYTSTPNEPAMYVLIKSTNTYDAKEFFKKHFCYYDFRIEYEIYLDETKDVIYV